VAQGVYRQETVGVGPTPQPSQPPRAGAGHAFPFFCKGALRKEQQGGTYGIQSIMKMNFNFMKQTIPLAPSARGREAEEAGHIILLIQPNYVKPFMKRHKNDAVDAVAIV